MATDKDTEIERIGWRVKAWARATGMCEASVYNRLAAKKIQARKDGGATIITTTPKEYLEGLPDYEPNARPSPNSTGKNGRRSRPRDDDRQPEPPPAAA